MRWCFPASRRIANVDRSRPATSSSDSKMSRFGRRGPTHALVSGGERISLTHLDRRSARSPTGPLPPTPRGRPAAGDTVRFFGNRRAPSQAAATQIHEVPGVPRRNTHAFPATRRRRHAPANRARSAPQSYRGGTGHRSVSRATDRRHAVSTFCGDRPAHHRQ
jgi:hypothetical protein